MTENNWIRRVQLDLSQLQHRLVVRPLTFADFEALVAVPDAISGEEALGPRADRE